MKTFKELLCSMSVLLLVLCLLCSCASDIDKNGQEATTPSAMSNGTDNTETVAPETTLFNDYNFGNTPLTILQRTAWVDEFFAEDITGEIINDAIHTRNREIEERIGVDLQFKDVIGGSTTFGTFSTEISNNINSGDNAYQLIANYAYYGVSLATKGYFVNLNQLPNLDVSSSWWNQSYVEQATVNNKLYFIIGDATTSALYELEACYINHDLAGDYFPDVNFYDVVMNGAWTYDYLLEVIKTVNGSGSLDTYGLAAPCNSVSIDGLLVALDIKLTERNSDGIPSITLTSDERVTNIVESLKELYHRTPGAHITEGSESRNIFIQGNSVFLFERMSLAKNYLRDVSFKYGIIPMPKWDSAQEAYHVTSHDEYSCLCVPVSIHEDQKEMIGTTLELLGAESQKTVRPVLYETAYKLKYLSDDQSSTMFDYITAGATYDFGYIYSNCINNPVHVLRNYVRYDYDGLASRIKSNAKVMDKLLVTFLEYFQKDDNS